MTTEAGLAAAHGLLMDPVYRSIHAAGCGGSGFLYKGRQINDAARAGPMTGPRRFFTASGTGLRRCAAFDAEGAFHTERCDD